MWHCMGYPTPLLFRIGLCLACLFSSIGLGHYLENPDEGTRPPYFLKEPEFTEVLTGGEGSLQAFANGAGNIQYQWYKNGEPIEGADQSSIRFINATRDDAGFYHVTAASEFGTTRSQLVRVRVGSREELSGVQRFYTGDQHGVRTTAFFAGQYVCAGDFGKVWSSMDGYDWQVRSPLPNEEHVLDLVVGAEKLIARLDDGRIAWSSDLESWTIVTVIPDGDSFFDVVHLNGSYAAFSTSGLHQLFTSPDGISWNLQHEFFEGSGSSGLAANNNLMIATRSNDEKTEVGITTNGIDWTFYESTQLASTGPLAFGEELYLAGSRGTWTSEDGFNWTRRDEIFGVQEIVKANGIYYGIDSRIVYRSGNLTDWEAVFNFDGLGHPSEPTSLSYSNGQFLLGPISGSIYPISDFSEFRVLGETHESDYNRSGGSIEYINGEFLMFTGRSGILVSDTGKSWRWEENRASNAYVSGIDRLVYGNGVYANGNLVGNGLDTLEGIDHPDPFYLSHIAFGNGVFVGLQQQTFVYSSDGYEWTSTDVFASLKDFKFTGGLFIGVGDDGRVATSSDGVSWILLTIRENGISGGRVDFEKIAYGNGRFVATARSIGGTELYASQDGRTWSKLSVDFQSIVSDPLFDPRVTDIEYGDGTFYIAFETKLLGTPDFEDWETISESVIGLGEIYYEGGTIIGNGYGIYQFGEPIGIPPQVEFRNVNPTHSVLGETVRVEASCVDLDGEITKVEFFEGSELISELSQEPYFFEWAGTKTGPHSFTVKAYDNSGLSSLDAIVVNVGQNIGAYGQKESDFVDIKEIVSFNGALYALRSDGVIFRSFGVDDWNIVFTPAFETPQHLTSANGILVAETDSAYYVCDDGINWRFLSQGIESVSPVGNWFIAQRDPHHLGLVKSRDLYNWSPVPENPNFDNGRNIIGVMNDQLIARSENEGEYFRLGAWGDWERVVFPKQGQLVMARHFDGVDYLWTRTHSPTVRYHLFRSSNGVDWLEVDIPVGLTEVEDFEKEHEVFVVSGGNSGGYVADADFEQWTQTPPIQSVSYQKGSYIGIVAGKVSRSEDGRAWESVLEPVIHNGGLASALSGFAAWNVDIHRTGHLWTSEDGENWNYKVRNEEKKVFTDLARNGESFVSIGQHYIGKSNDGVNWTHTEKPKELADSIAFGNDVFLASGQTGNVGISVDGLTWEFHSVGDYEGLTRQVHFLEDPGLFIVETGSVNYWTSIDGVQWVERSFGTVQLSEFNQVGRWIFAWSNNGVYQTDNGIDWEAAETLNYSTTVFYLDGIYLAQTGDWREPIRRSVDGITWEAADIPFARTFAYLRAYDFGFIAFLDGSRSYDYMTTDGLSWSKINVNAPLERSMVVNGERYFSGRPSKTSLSDLAFGSLVREIGDDGRQGTVRLKGEIWNLSDERVEDVDLELKLLLTGNQEWTIKSRGYATTQSLPGLTIPANGTVAFDLELNLPDWAQDGNYGVHAFLEGGGSLFDTIQHNNYAWERLLGLPALWVNPTEEGESKSVVLKWRSDVGYTNEIQHSNDLKVWLPLGPAINVNDNSIQTTTDSSVGNAQRFYRLKAE